MKQLFFLSVVLLLANACGRDRTDTDPAAAPAVRVELRVRPDCTAVATRAADETAIHDVNLWLCDPRIITHTVPLFYNCFNLFICLRQSFLPIWAVISKPKPIRTASHSPIATTATCCR